jgi:hypothetical protein
MTATILAILNSQAALFLALIGSQTPAQKQVMWDRYITLTAPLHALLMRIEKVTPAEMAATEAATLAALAPPVVPVPTPGVFQTTAPAVK